MFLIAAGQFVMEPFRASYSVLLRSTFRWTKPCRWSPSGAKFLVWFCLLASAVPVFSASFPPPTIEWLGGVSADWREARNWSPARVPVAADHVLMVSPGNTISAPGTVRVASIRVGQATGLPTRLVTSGDFGASQGAEVLQAGGIQLAGGAWTGSGAIRVLGDFQWTAGRIYGAVTVESGATGLMSGGNLHLGSDDVATPASITNRGTLTFRGSSSYAYAYAGSRIVNEGLWRLDSANQQFYFCCAGPIATFENQGVIEKLADDQDASIGNIRFLNSGEVRVLQATLSVNTDAEFGAGGRFTGGAKLRLVGGTSTFQGEQRVELSLELAGAAIRGNPVFRGPTPVRWVAGRIYDALTIESGATLQLVGSSLHLGSDSDAVPCLMTNRGTVEWSASSSYVYAYNHSKILNEGLWRLLTDTQLFYHCCSGQLGEFVNKGTLERSSNEGVANLGNISLDNYGTIRVEQGPLQINTTATFRNGARVTGDEPLRLVGGDATFQGLFQVQGPLELAGANIRGSARFSGSSPVAWTRGRSFGEIIVEPSTTFEIVGASLHLASDDNANPATLTNRGLVLWRTPSSYVYAYNHGTIVNEGTWRVETETQMFYHCCGGSLGLFVNKGTLSKAAGVGPTTLGNLVLDQRGLITASVGAIHINADAEFNDGSRIGGSQPTRLVGGNHVMRGKLVLQGGGLELAGANIRGVGSFAGPAPLIWSASRLFGQLNLDAGATMLVSGGSHHFASDDNQSPASITNRGTIRWVSPSAYVYAYNSSQIINQGLWSFEVPTSQAFYYCCGGGGGRFVNQGRLQKSPGFGEGVYLGAIQQEERGEVLVASGIFTMANSINVYPEAQFTVSVGNGDTRVHFQSAATLAGKLKVQPAAGAVLDPFGSYRILTFGSPRSGAFAVLDLPESETPDVWSIRYGLNFVDLFQADVCAANGLLGWWPGDGSPDDALGLNPGKLLNGATYTNGLIGKAFLLNGVSAAVDLGGWTPGTTWTLDAWVNPSALPAGRHTILGGFAQCLDWGLVQSGTALGVGFRPPSGCSDLLLATNVISAGNWYHVAATRDGNEIRFYLNGRLEGTSLADPDYVGTASGVRIGGEACCSGNNFAGIVDEPAIFDHALNLAEVLAIASNGNQGRCAGLGFFVQQFTPVGVLPDAFSRVTAQFNQPIATASLTRDDIQVITPNGALSPAQIEIEATADPRRLSILLPLQKDEGDYQIIVGPSINDLGGHPMTGGLAATNILRIDHTGPRVLAMSPSGVVLTRVDALEVAFDAPIALASLSTADLVIAGAPAPSVISVSWVTNSTYRFQLSGPLQPGAYTVTVGPNVSDAAGNAMDQDRDGVLGEATQDAFTAAVEVRAADLIVVGVETAATANAGSATPLVVTLRNQGLASAVGPWRNEILMSPNASGDAAASLGSFIVASTLAPGATMVITQQVILPATLSGGVFFGILADRDGQVVEINRDNNRKFTVAPTVVNAPDLAVTTFLAPASVVLGRAATVEWRVNNIGSAQALSAGVDRIYLSRSSNSIAQAILVAELAGQPLAAGTSYQRSLSVIPPIQIFGNDPAFYWILVVDAAQSQSEASESNNRAFLPVQVTLPPLPDLLPLGIACPASLAPDQPFQVTWAVTNRGNLSAEGAWVEQVYVSDSLNRSVPLVFLRITNSIPAGSSLVRTQFVQLPASVLAGPVRLGVSIDRDGELVESNDDNNNALALATSDVELALLLDRTSFDLKEGDNTVLLLTRNSDPVDALSVTVSNSVASALSGPSQVVFAAGQRQVSVPLTALADDVPDPDQLGRLTFAAEGFRTAFAAYVVHNVDEPTLRLTVDPNPVREGMGATATLKRTGSLAAPLLVSLDRSDLNRLEAPQQITLAAGEAQSVFAVVALDNPLVEPTTPVTLTARAVGYKQAIATVNILDDDFPNVELVLDRDTVSEGAGAQAAVGRVVRSGSNVRPLVLELSSANPALLQVPSVVSIAAGRSEYAFPIAVTDDALVNGTRSVPIRLFVRRSGSTQIVGEIPGKTVQVTDNDGPALKLTLDRDVAREGQAVGALATIERNTPTTQALIVTVSSSDMTEATVPATVTIPAGAASASFAVATVDDQSIDGNQAVTVRAVAAGFAPAAAGLVVSDVNLPDLAAVQIVGPARAESDSTIPVTYRIVNRGFSAAPGPITTRVLLSSDSVLGGDAIQGQFTINDPIPVGVPVEQTVQVRMPRQTGFYWLVAATDALEAVEEIREDNNVLLSALPVQVVAGYTAVAQTDIAQGLPGVAVPIHGTAVKTDGSPAANVPVSIHITVRGFRRVIAAVTDSKGAFAAQFIPLPGEGGRYEIGAAHPGEAAAPVQDQFSILGFQASPASVALNLRPLQTEQTEIQLQNLSDIPLTGLKATIVGAPPGMQLVVSNTTDTLEGFGTALLRIVATPTAEAPRSGVFGLNVSTSQGASNVVAVSFFVTVPTARLVSLPGQIETRIRPGSQKVVSFDIVNQGGATSGPVWITLPGVPWMSIASTNPIPPMPPGTTNPVTLLLTPSIFLDLGAYDGALALNGEGAGFSVPFNIQAISDSKGAVTVRVEDEFTFYAEGAPRVTNATVVIRNAVTQDVVTNAVSDAYGEVKVDALPEGDYLVEASSPKHSNSRDYFKVVAGREIQVSTFISRELVEYNWTVVPVEVEDRTHIVIETIFETVVPAPVVTVTPSSIDLDEIQGDEAQIDFVIQNHGLIAARDMDISFNSHPAYTLTPLVSQLGTLGAQSSIVVPVILRRTSGAGGQAGLASVGLAGGARTGPCGGSGQVKHKLRCGAKDNTYVTPITLRNAGNCGGGGSGSGGGGGGGGGWGYGGGGGGGGGGGAGAFIARRTFKPKDNCQCDPDAADAPLLQGCFEMGIGGPFASLAGSAANSALKAINGSASLDLNGNVKVCTCCDEDGWGITKEGTIEIAGQVTAEIPLVGKTFKTQVEGVGESAQAEWGVGCALKLQGAIKGAVQGSTECHDKNGKLCYSVTVELNGAAECSIGGKVSATVGGKTEESALRGYANVNSGYSGVFQGCDGQPSTSQYCLKPVVAEGGFEIQVAGIKSNPKVTQELIKGECYDSSPPSPAPADILSQLPESVANDVNRQIEEAVNKLVEEARQKFSRSGPRTAGVAPSRLLPKVGPQLAGVDDGVCARVKLRLEQDLILTRQGFEATLELINRDPANELENLSVEVAVFDSEGHSATDLFGIRSPRLNNLSAVDGSGVLVANSSGTATFTLIPTRDAAPDKETEYFVGGFLSYRLEGKEVVTPMVPVPITVRPDPRLSVKYFHQRDVFGDDPFTKDILEPSVPYTLAVMVDNRGKGDARNVRIVSGQPQIVENEKGLAIDFKIIATEVAGRGVSPSLTANFGEIKGGDRGIARWLLTSTLQGLFTDYKATFEHVDSLGKTNLSLVDEVTIHEMIHQVEADRQFSDGKPDFLVNDQSDPDDLPDTLYLSSGVTNAVDVILNAQVTGDVNGAEHSVQISVAGRDGWSYLRIPDPAGGLYELTRMERQDGSVVALGTNVWITDRTFIGHSMRPRYESTLHFLEYGMNSTYTLFYSQKTTADTNAPQSRVLSLPAVSGPVIPLLWEGGDEVGGSGLAVFDVFVSVNDGPFTAWITNSVDRGGVYRGIPGSRYAFYSQATDHRGNREPAPLLPDAVTFVENRTNQPPVIQSVGPQSLNEGDVFSLTVVATDPDLPQQSLIYSLVDPVPAGMTIDAQTGAIRWSTGEASGPASWPIKVSVRDTGFPSLTSTLEFGLTVLEVNRPPVLLAMDDQVVAEGRELLLASEAVDLDLPKQALRYSLLNGPAGASIHAATGVLRWRPGAFQGGETYRMQVVVCDDGVPSLCATQSVAITVRDTQVGMTVAANRTNVVAGQSGRIAFEVQSGKALDRVSFGLSLPEGSLRDLTLVPASPDVLVASLQRVALNQFTVNIQSRPEAGFEGRVGLVDLRFNTLADASSLSLDITPMDPTGLPKDGTPIVHAISRSGHLYLVGGAPLLEASPAASRKVQLTLYGRASGTYVLESADRVDATTWTPVDTITLGAGEEKRVLPLVTSTGIRFYRARVAP